MTSQHESRNNRLWDRAARAIFKNGQRKQVRSSNLPKRCCDLLLSSIGLIISAPIMALAAVAILLDSPGPVFFRQKRIGRHGRTFICTKLRTMRLDTGDRPSHEVRGSMVTRVGHFLRRTKLDELPQLWNVLRGEMSLVGPRPCLPIQTELIEARKSLGIERLRPGITGISQVKGVDMSDPQELASLDATYRPSLTTDFKLILATVTGSGRGDRVSK